MSARNYTIAFVVTAAVFFPVFWFAFFDSYVSPISGILVVLLSGYGDTGGAIAMMISTGIYLAIFVFAARFIYHRSTRIESIVQQKVLLSIPLLAFLVVSLLPIIHRDGWGGRSFNYTFWSACGRMAEKIQGTQPAQVQE